MKREPLLNDSVLDWLLEGDARVWVGFLDRFNGVCFVVSGNRGFNRAGGVVTCFTITILD